jgi:NAD(P)-dependent dehydrogenase (short-subunit alcohol dehydrogenase family)
VSPTEIFRRGLLDGQVVAVVCGGPFAAAAVEACAELGADVVALGPGADPQGAVDPQDEPAVAEALTGAAARHGALHTLVVDAAGLFAAAPPEGLDPLRAAVDPAWVAARAAANAAMIEAADGGKVVVLAPPPAAGPHADAARAALENFARTLSIEWARHQIRVVAITPGAATAPPEVGALVAYLASPAGDYFSGCVLSLGEAG